MSLGSKCPGTTQTGIQSFVIFHHKLFAFKCRLQKAFANSLDPDQARQKVGPDLDPNGLTP